MIITAQALAAAVPAALVVMLRAPEIRAVQAVLALLAQLPGQALLALAAAGVEPQKSGARVLAEAAAVELEAKVELRQRLAA